MMRKNGFVAMGLAGLLAACTYVQSQPGAEKVVLFQPGQVTRCTQLGSVKVSVLDRVGFVARSSGKVESELQALARNSAVDMGGDTITAAGPVSEGKQTFNIYRCLR